ncbi:hypothetical protein [Acinetobacter sp. MB5]|uniref:hypothetical protein n=1 Tax=Acinetobacter sp. MB5 TaxID=2069438 RepID=UPI000DD04B52|nr:hypothetical protein [Acinetobacter sp. MB5]
MNIFAKVALVSATLLSLGTLTACQSMTKPHDPMMEAGPHHGHHGPRMSEEEMEKRKAVFEQFKQACNNQPVGAKVQVKLAEKTISGTCELRFKPDHDKDHPLPPPPPADAPAPTAPASK